MAQLTLLYADDDANDVFFMQRAAERSALPLVLHIVDDGLHVVDYLRAGLPSVLLLDLRMPLMSGLEVLKWMREAGGSAVAVPVIMFSSATIARDVEAAYKLGAVAFIEKPKGTAALVQLLRSIYECAQRENDPRCWRELQGRINPGGLNAALDATSAEDNDGASRE